MSDPANPYLAPPVDFVVQARDTPNAMFKPFLVIALVLLGIAMGCCKPWLPSDTNLPSQFVLLHVILSSLLVLWWYDLDQRELGHRPSFFSRLLMLICPLFMLPFHFLMTRGPHYWKWIGGATLYFLVVKLLEIASSTISQWLLQWLHA